MVFVFRSAPFRVPQSHFSRHLPTYGIFFVCVCVCVCARALLLFCFVVLVLCGCVMVCGVEQQGKAYEPGSWAQGI